MTGVTAAAIAEDRAAGALAGLAVGDALGMPTQMLPREMVRRLFGDLSWFQPGPAENAISAGWPAGRITDDTEQALLLARLLIEGGGRIDAGRFAAGLIAWARQAGAGGPEQLGPSSRRALDDIAAGAPIEEAGRTGATNGAAMRIAPVGIAVSAANLHALVDRVEQACVVTHHTGTAISGAAAVAAAVSAGLDGLGVGQTFQIACRAAALGARRGHYVAGADIAQRITWAVELVNGRDDEAAAGLIDGLVGTGVATEQAVPAAFAIASLWPDNPWQACVMAARLGGDSDTIGALTGAIVGARTGTGGFPAAALAMIEDVNGLGLDDVARGLLALRTASREPAGQRGGRP